MKSTTPPVASAARARPQVARGLGTALDKREQCSAWGRRPLSAAQVRYAALDAAVLLDLDDAHAGFRAQVRAPSSTG